MIRLLLMIWPLLGLGWLWSTTHDATRQGVEWNVPVAGYDPRDLLRGHFVQFTYQWPEDPEARLADDNFSASGLCLEGKAPIIARATRFEGPASAPTCAGIAREPGRGARPDQTSIVPHEGRLYVSQAQAQALQKQLANPKLSATLRFRLRPDGVIVPLRLSFAPKR